jgi:peptide/nickel transport system permease protein
VTIPTTDLTIVTPEAALEGGGRRRRFRFVNNSKTAVGLITVILYLVFAVIGPWVAPYDPSKRSRDLLQPPSSAHWFGTTHLGQDIFSQILVGTRGVMFVGLLAGVVAMVISIIMGITAGYLGGAADDILSAITNVILVIPALPLIIIISATVENSGDLTVALVIGFTSWSWGARILRAQTLSLRQRDYVQASRASGETSWRIIGVEIMPNLLAIIASSFVSTVIFAVLTEITLAFIGISNVSTWNWGTILFWAQSEQALAQGAWWWFVPAGLAIAILGTALALLNFGIDEFVNPRLRSSGATKVRTADGRKVRMRVGFTPVLMARKKPSALNGSREALNGADPGLRAGRSSIVTPVVRPVVEQVEPNGPPGLPASPGEPGQTPPERKGAGQ